MENNTMMNAHPAMSESKNSLTGIAAVYRIRIENLRESALLDGFDIQPSSESDFWEFMNMVPNWPKASLILIDDGNLRVAWLRNDDTRVNLEFIGDGIVVLSYFLCGQPPIDYRRFTLVEAIEDIRQQGLSPVVQGLKWNWHQA